MRIKCLFQLVYYFIITEIVGGIELVIWFSFRDLFISFMNLENDVFGIKYIVPFILVFIPLISAISEYQSKKAEISKAFNCLFSKF